MSEYREGIGRRTEAEVHKIGWAELIHWLRALEGDVTRVDSSDAVDVERFLEPIECISFSDVSEEVANELTKLAEESDALFACFRWDESKPYASKFLWNQLILKRVLAQSQIFADYEKIPPELMKSGTHVQWKATRRPERADWFYYNFYGSFSVEEGASMHAWPRNLVQRNTIYRAFTPLRGVLKSSRLKEAQE